MSKGGGGKVRRGKRRKSREDDEMGNERGNGGQKLSLQCYLEKKVTANHIVQNDSFYLC